MNGDVGCLIGSFQWDLTYWELKEDGDCPKQIYGTV